MTPGVGTTTRTPRVKGPPPPMQSSNPTQSKTEYRQSTIIQFVNSVRVINQDVWVNDMEDEILRALTHAIIRVGDGVRDAVRDREADTNDESSEDE